jgi:hypothetical protein
VSKRTTITLPTLSSGKGGRVNVTGLNEFSRDFKKLPKDIQSSIRTSAKKSVGYIVKEATEAATQGEKQQPAMSKAIRADFFKGAPAIIGGGSKKVRLRRGKDGKTHVVPAGALFVGAEFGAKKLKQFPRRSPRFGRGNEGYFFYPAIRKAFESGRAIREFVAGIDTALKRNL